MAKIKKAVEPAEQRSVLMYVGPTVPSLGLIQNVIYDGIPDAASACFVDTPLLQALFVGISSYPEAERALRDRTGYIWAAFNAALEYRNTKGGR